MDVANAYLSHYPCVFISVLTVAVINMCNRQPAQVSLSNELRYRLINARSSSLLIHWGYCSLALSHWLSHGQIPRNRWLETTHLRGTTMYGSVCKCTKPCPICFFLVPITFPLMERVGHRRVMMVGAIAGGLSFFLTSFATNITYVLLVFGILFGKSLRIRLTYQLSIFSFGRNFLVLLS